MAAAYLMEQPLKEINGVLYGVIDGYMTTISDQKAGKEVSISISDIDEEMMKQLELELQDNKNARKYRIASFEVQESFLSVMILDNTLTMKYIEEFRVWFYPVLKQTGVKGAEICPICKQPLYEDKVYRMLNHKACIFHEACSGKISDEIEKMNEYRKLEKGNFADGFLGALIGGLVGAVPWAILYAVGWFSGWLGLIIGYFAQIGYLKFGGKRKKFTVVILLITLTISVVLGQLLGESLKLVGYILKGNTDYSLLQIPKLFGYLFLHSNPFLNAFRRNFLFGMFFALLGNLYLFYTIFRQANAQITITEIEPY